MAHHKGETMERPEYERRLEEHREERGAPAGAAGSLSADTIVLDVVEADREPFEQERYGRAVALGSCRLLSNTKTRDCYPR